MKLPLTLTFLLTTAFIVKANEEIKTRVAAATVYTQGAQIKRYKKLNLKKGENIIRFTGLERDINANSIQLFGIQENTNFTVVYTQYSIEGKKIEGLSKKSKIYKLLL